FHTALEDVENALAAYYAETARREHLARSAAAYEEALALARTRYAKGLTTFLDVLVIEASLYEAQQAVSQSEATLRESLVSLYKALGGGWKAASHNGSGDTAEGGGKNGPSGPTDARRPAGMSGPDRGPNGPSGRI
ncbi:MAG: TolC family protein, partial [Thermodesulfobacteriota bacterium]